MHINGTINDAALDSLLTRVLSCVTKLPGLSLIGVQKKLLPALQPHCTRELLEVISFDFKRSENIEFPVYFLGGKCQVVVVIK